MECGICKEFLIYLAQRGKLDGPESIGATTSEQISAFYNLLTKTSQLQEREANGIKTIVYLAKLQHNLIGGDGSVYSPSRKEDYFESLRMRQT